MGTPWVSFNGKDCSGCKHLNDRGYCEFTACIIPCTVRATIPEVKPKTNADRIRSMSDEELAENLMKAYDCPKGKDCVEQMPGEDGFHQCKRCWVEWLRQECAE